jgi:N-acyl-D-aspartate/D-glutamate deacylase
VHDLVIRGGAVVDGSGAERFSGDVAIDGDRITAVGGRAGSARREIDARGLLVTPGWVDIHTHYDGQVTWDPHLSPSSWHGVTTAVMGNCGVGFAPVHPGEEAFLIRVMEGVEDIPGSALAEGIDWKWESFPQYLDALDTMPRAIDVATQVPHCALRAYVMGEARAHDDEARPDDIEEMARLTRAALQAGALGFSTSRTILHRSKDGPLVPGTHARPEELLGIARTLGEVGHGVFEMVSDLQGQEPDLSWMCEFARKTGRPITFALAQTDFDREGFRKTLAKLQELRAEGLEIVAQVPGRPVGLLLGLQSSLHPFLTHPTYRELSDLPHCELVARLRQPEIRERILAEEPGTRDRIARALMQNFSKYFPLGDPPDYEPPEDASVLARARRENRSVEAVTYDLLLEREGRQLLYMPLASYVDYDFEALREMLLHPASVISLSDGGAHVGVICDASTPTYMLSHWARDRRRGPTLPLETVVRLQTRETAALYGLHDRGSIALGMKADLNVIDFDALHLHAPQMVFDLPSNEKRLVQRADGYRATLVGGEVTFENGEPTGALPGRLVRGPQST